MQLDSWQAALDSDQKLALQTTGSVHNVATMPGFRFQPTEEELVGFYLQGMVMGNRLEVDLINVLNLYRYDPWELPAMSFVQSEREWLFFCPRNKKYPNGARPNRVTASGYWKATGTDKPVRRAHDARCIGLKKTLVFYAGKAPRGRKTEWIMNEYRLQPQNEPSSTFCQTLRSLKGKSTSNDLDLRDVALCRIYKKPPQINLISATANLFANNFIRDNIVDPLGSTSTAHETSPSLKLAGSNLLKEMDAKTTSSAYKTNIVEDLKDLSSSFMLFKDRGIPAPAIDLNMMERDGFSNSGSLFTVIPSLEELHGAYKQHDRNTAIGQQTVNRLNWSDCFPKVSVSLQHSSSSLSPSVASIDRLLTASTWSPLQPLPPPGARMKLNCGYNISELDKIGCTSAAVPQNINSHFEWNSLPL